MNHESEILRNNNHETDDYHKNQGNSHKVPLAHAHRVYSRAGESTVSYVHLYQVQNTLLRINYFHLHCQPWCPAALAPTIPCDVSLNQVHRHCLHTMDSDACAWFGPIPTKSQVLVK